MVSDAIKLLIGLGNPGDSYVHTRHNAGFFFVNKLVEVYGGKFSSLSKCFGSEADISIDGQRLRCFLPSTFMNDSGRAVGAYLRFRKWPTSCMMVAHDELDFPLGQCKLKMAGGHGGHNGLRDIMAHVGSADFLRLRIGIGRPISGDSAHFVLSKMPLSDQAILDEKLEAFIPHMPALIAGDIEKVMGDWHTPDDGKKG
jgi:peptidyl-tRNA hydrolase, PTH1 family